MFSKSMSLWCFFIALQSYSQSIITNKNILNELYNPPLAKIDYTSNFGYRIHPIHQTLKFHNGVDIKAYYEPVYAVSISNVVDAGYNKVSGNYIVLEDLTNNVNYIYAHLSQIFIKKGELIKKGKKIGVSGNSGHSTGPHLHFAIKKNGVYLNPVIFLEMFED